MHARCRPPPPTHTLRPSLSRCAAGGSSWGEEGYVYLRRGDNECGIATPGQSVIPTVEGGVLPPPPPPPPPRPVWQCPPDATAVNDSVTAACMWHNGTAGMVMPPPDSIGNYCAYMSQGYMGYVWPATMPQSQYPCAPSFGASNNGGSDWFCVLEVGQNGFTAFPAGATALCDHLSDGVIGYSWAVGGADSD